MATTVVIKLLSIIWIASASPQNSINVETSTGSVRGRFLSPLKVYEFIGIPYAEAPIGDLRFKRTSPIQPWSVPLESAAFPPMCPQIFLEENMFGFAIDGELGEPNEDCLFLNIWVPQETLERKILKTAPYTFIHGGGFIEGFTSAYNGSVLASYNKIVVASMQYRLGSLGFYYDGTEDAPGNQGLWDQLEAMKWLCKNFEAFGADCEKHTIGGESAGAISVGFHILSPYSKDYFKRAIYESGSPLPAYTISTKEKIIKMGDIMVQNLQNGSCVGKSDLIECLRTVPSAEFPSADAVVMAEYLNSFSPVIEGNFVPDDPMKMMQAGNFYKVPTIIGANMEEGGMFLLMAPEMADLAMKHDWDFDAVKGDLNTTIYGQILQSLFGATILEKYDILIDAVKTQYWPINPLGKPTGSQLFDAISQAFGDYLLTCPTYKWADLMAENGASPDDIWVYRYTHNSRHEIVPDWMGVTHAVELPIVFGDAFQDKAKNFNFSYDDKIFSQVMMELWSNFIKFGNPNTRDETSPKILKGPLQYSAWKPYSAYDCKPYTADLSVLSQVYSYGQGYTCGFKQRECSFWYEVFLKLENLFKEITFENYKSFLK